MHHFNRNIHGHSGLPDPKNIVVYEVALKGKKKISEGTYAFVFEKPKGFKFKAGQHIRMTLIKPTDTDSEGNSRFFSVAGTPQEKDLLFAMRMRDTAFKRVLKTMQIGSKVRIQMRLDNPHGSFTLHDDISKPAVFIVGGIGIIPAFSMIKDAIERKLTHKIFLFYSNRRPEDAPFLKKLQDLAKQNPNFKLIATMTQIENSSKSWQGEIGKINLSLLKKYLNDLKTPIYYVAGLPKMVSAIKTLLTDSRIDENNIRAEEFTGFNLNEMHGMMKSSTRYLNKSHIVLISMGLVILVVFILHFVVATSLLKSGLNVAIFKNPLFYLMIVLMLVIVPFKLKHLVSFIHKNKK